jgi:hypothetical protein
MAPAADEFDKAGSDAVLAVVTQPDVDSANKNIIGKIFICIKFIQN